VCPEEDERQCPDSPGVVVDDESLGYLLYSPELWLGGELSNAAFSRSKLRAGQVSVFRTQYCDAAIVEREAWAPLQARDPNRALAGVAVALCERIRLVRNGPDRAVCVVDAGRPNYAAHAHLGFSSSVTNSSPSIQTAVRANLCRAFETELPRQLTDLFRSTAGVNPPA